MTDMGGLTLQGLSKKQRRIAELLWICETKEEVAAVTKYYGQDAFIVADMMMAEHLDTVMDTDLAKLALAKF